MKKLRCQVIDNLSQDQEISRKGSVSQLCDYLGISRQGYYSHVERASELDVLRTSIVLYSQEIRKDMPRVGMLKLHLLCCEKFGDKMTIGRDQCVDILDQNGFALRKSKKPRTTNSNHNYFIYPDLLNTVPKLVAHRSGQLCVTDITYVATENGWAYLSLVTDAASRMIVGHCLHPTLGKEGPVKAFQMAKGYYESQGVSLSGLIHHSDRGSQYCCNEYVSMLKGLGVLLSMTQTGDPLHNALAERMNNTIKNEWLFDCGDEDFGDVSSRIDNAIRLYNVLRPHMALGMRTPEAEMKRILAAV